MYQQVPLPQNLTLYMYQPCTPSTSLTPDTQEPHATAHSPVEPLPLRPSTSQNALPSSEMNRSNLVLVKRVGESYSMLKNKNKAGTLINKVALEAAFGKDVMRRCTPLGSRDLPALSPKEFYNFKVVTLNLFPQASVEFEQLWSKCTRTYMYNRYKSQAYHWRTATIALH